MNSEIRIYVNSNVRERLKAAEEKDKNVIHRLVLSPCDGKYTVCVESWGDRGPVHGELFLTGELFEGIGV